MIFVQISECYIFRKFLLIAVFIKFPQIEEHLGGRFVLLHSFIMIRVEKARIDLIKKRCPLFFCNFHMLQLFTSRLTSIFSSLILLSDLSVHAQSKPSIPMHIPGIVSFLFTNIHNFSFYQVFQV